MANSVFRKKSLDRISSPEQLNDYIKVSNPSVWMIIVAIFVLIGSVGYWAYAGSMETVVSCSGVSSQKLSSSSGLVDHVICYVSSDDYNKLEAAYAELGELRVRVTPKDTSTYGYITGLVTAVSNAKVSSDKVFTDVSQDGVDQYTASQLLNSEYGVRFDITLDRDATHPKWLAWSKNEEGRAVLLDGTLCDVQIITNSEKPYGFLFSSN